jgi:hypothetical protein
MRPRGNFKPGSLRDENVAGTPAQCILGRIGLCHAVCWSELLWFEVSMLHLLVHDVAQHRAIQSNAIRNRYKQGNVFV